MLKPVAAFFFLAITVLPSFAEAGCPVINGTYLMEYKREGEKIHYHELILNTRNDRGQFSYSFNRDGRFQIADGKKYPIKVGDREGTKRLECVGDSLLQEMQAAGSEKIWWRKISVRSRSQLSVEGNYEGKSGTYDLEI